MAKCFDLVRILLTGASGFAGAHMLKELLYSDKYEIICPVTYMHGGNLRRIPALLEEKSSTSYKLIELDLAGANAVERLVDIDFDIVINFASESHVDRSIKSPLLFFHNNIDLMINLLEISRIKRINHFVHVSTDEVYGYLPMGSINNEWQFPHRPSNPYSASKSSQESIAMSYSKTFNVPITIINSTNLIGEAQNQEKFLPKTISKVLSGELIYIDTDNAGHIGSRKYLYAGDLAKAIHLVINNIDSNDPLLRKFHISGNEEYSNLNIVNLVGSLLGVKPNVKNRISPRPGYDLRYELNSDKIRLHGWQESGRIKSHVDKILKWTLLNPEWLTIDYD